AQGELERVATLKGIRAVYLGTNVNGRELSAPEFAPVFARLEALGLPVLLHPISVVGAERLRPFYLHNLLGNPFDTAIAAAHLVFGGVLDRHPKLQVCLPHASGLSLIFGVMRIVNLAHGSYFMLGGYVGLSVVWRTGSFTAALVAGAVAIALIGIGMERLFLRRLSGQTLGQVLMTIGFALMFQDLALLIWGGDPYTIPLPAALQGFVTAGALRFPTSRIFIIVVRTPVRAACLYV